MIAKASVKKGENEHLDFLIGSRYQINIVIICQQKNNKKIDKYSKLIFKGVLLGLKLYIRLFNHN